MSKHTHKEIKLSHSRRLCFQATLGCQTSLYGKEQQKHSDGCSITAKHQDSIQGIEHGSNPEKPTEGPLLENPLWQPTRQFYPSHESYTIFDDKSIFNIQGAWN